ncbi:MAG: TIM barrel protein [Candidatus Nanohaloarchaeota archaeon]|nr:TIM barrel protein [Candidatus Nanohaloarchaeota archaeon]
MLRIRGDRLRIGTGGIPLSTPNPTILSGIKRIRELGLDAMELEFVRSVNLSKENAKIAKRIAEENDVVLTAHAPYYINLNAVEKEKIDASIKRILLTAERTWEAGGYSIVFHAAYYLKSAKSDTYKKVKRAVEFIVKNLQDRGIEIWIRPETTGKPTQFGDLDELIKLSQEVEMVLPCVDFAHLHARSNGKFNTYEEFSEVLSKIEEGLGRDALDNMHIHFSGIEYGEKGEKNHLTLKESDLNYEDMVRAWKDFKIKGVAISESPNLEGDALLIKNLLY